MEGFPHHADGVGPDTMEAAFMSEPETWVSCPGTIEVGGRVFKCVSSFRPSEPDSLHKSGLHHAPKEYAEDGTEFSLIWRD